MTIQNMAEVLTPGTHGEAALSVYEVTLEEARFCNLRAAINPGRPDSSVTPGKYAQLHVNKRLVMSDTDMERRSNREVIRKAHGSVLIAGFGLGMILLPILRKPEVQLVTCIEKSRDVLELVRPQIVRAEQEATKNKLITHCADIFEWKPSRGQKFETIYFDIWADYNSDLLDEITRLHHRFSHYLNRNDPNAWMGSWMQHEMRSMKRRGW